MVNSTWNRLSLMIKNGKIDYKHRGMMLLNTGLDVLDMDLGVVTYVRGNQLLMQYATQSDLQGTRYALDTTLCQFVMDAQDVLAVHNTGGIDWEMYHIAPEFRFGAYISIPIFLEDDVYGTVFFAKENKAQYPFSERDIAYLKMMAGSFRAIILQDRQAAERQAVVAQY